MPIHHCKAEDLEQTVAAVEHDGETVVQVELRRGGGGYWVITNRPTNDTGRAWAPAAKETR